jgi:hypothetical protein
MKKLRYLAVFGVVLVLALALASWAGAFQFTYTSGFQLQNLEGSTANVVLSFYNQDGSVAAAVNDTVAANGSNTYFPLNAVPDGFNGSVVISSDRQVAAVTNVHGDNFVANASYVGQSAGATSVQLPLLMKGNSGFNTWFNVQNTGASTANVTATYSSGTVVGPVAIPVGASHTFDQSTETHSQAVFSGVITSDQPVVATVMEENSSLLFAYNGFASGSTNPVLPLINANNSGFTTGIQIQNTGGTSTDVTLSYTPSLAGTACTESKSIAPGASATFALYVFAGTPQGGTTSNCVGGATFIGSAQVTSNSAGNDLVAIVNQHKLTGPGANGEAYGGFDPGATTDTVVMPLIMDRNSGYWTGFNVQNVGGAATTVNCSFTGTSYVVGPTVLNPGEALTALQNGNVQNAYVGSGTCTASGGGQIVGVVNELGPSSTADQLLVYEGISN